MSDINRDNLVNFYLGTAVEHYIISQFYILGYEANKFNPDFGYDLLVSNKAQSIFKDAEISFKYIQVKSTPTFKKSAKLKFWLSEKELGMVINDENAYVIFVNCNFDYENDPASLVPTYLQSMEMLEEMIDAEALTNFFDTKEKKELLSKFNKVDFSYIWLSSKQLNRLQNENFIVHELNGKRTLTMEKEEGGNIKIENKAGVFTIIPELRNLFYLVNKSRSYKSVDEINIFYEDL